MKRMMLAAFAAALIVAAPAGAAEVPENADWSEHYFEAEDGTRLHADLLRPKGLPEGAKTPVIVTVSPYLNRNGQTTPDDPTADGPSSRFYDFLEQGKVLERGYSYLMVDLRGFGGSGGCNDWGGPGEQMDAKAAVEWAASQDWSTGKVGTYGKSYDGWTGLMAIAQRPKGLSAVVSQEPVYDGYRYLYMNRVRFLNSIATPTLFTAIDANPGSTGAGPDYVLNGATGTDPSCYAANIAFQQADNPWSQFWSVRNLTPQVKGATTPLLLTQGFLEDNTKPDDAFTFWNNMAGPKRAWLGQWDHVRGNDRDADTGEILMGREGFIDETMEFFGQHLKGEAAPDRPQVLVQQGADGRFREEASWPPADSRPAGFDLLPAEYTDDGQNSGDATGSSPGNGSWTFTPPFRQAAHLSGVPRITFEVWTPGQRENLVANVYEISPEGSAQLLSRGAFLLPGSGRHSFDLYGQDWTIEPGERIGVLLSTANDEWWTHLPTNHKVSVYSARIELPFLSRGRTEFVDGAPAAKLTSYLEEAPFQVEPEVIAEREAPFAFGGGGAPGPGNGGTDGQAQSPRGSLAGGSGARAARRAGVDGRAARARLRLLRRSRASLRRGRLTATVRCNEACTVELSGLVRSGRSRGALRSKRIRLRQVGTRRVTLIAGRAAKRLLRARGARRVELRAFVTDADGNVSRASASARL